MKSKLLAPILLGMICISCHAEDVMLLSLRSNGKVVAQRSFETSHDLRWDRSRYQEDPLTSGRCENISVLPGEHGFPVGRDIQIAPIATGANGATIYMIRDTAMRRVGATQMAIQDCVLAAPLIRSTVSIKYVALKTGDMVTVPPPEGSDESLQVEIRALE